jgi:hypothetical protein
MYSSFNVPPADFRLPDTPGLTDAERDELAEDLWIQVVLARGGAEDFADYYEGVTSLSREALAAAWEHAHTARRVQQAAWTSVPPLPLAAAFAELDAGGVLARADFTCCGTCGATEIADERDESRHWRGYVFFHQQDTEALVADGSVHLSYGVFAPPDFDGAAFDALPAEEQNARWTADVRRLVDDDVRSVLARHGIGLDWDGSTDRRLRLTGIDWYVPA